MLVQNESKPQKFHNIFEASLNPLGFVRTKTFVTGNGYFEMKLPVDDYTLHEKVKILTSENHFLLVTIDKTLKEASEAGFDSDMIKVYVQTLGFTFYSYLM